MMRWQVALVVGVLAGCGPTRSPGSDDAAPEAGGPEAPGCALRCSDDLHAVLDCNDAVVAQCGAAEACSEGFATCTNACAAAESGHRSIGCDYYATYMDVVDTTRCYAVFVANTWTAPAKIAVSYRNAAVPIGSIAYVPKGTGPNLTYEPYNELTGIPPGEVAVLFLGGELGAAPRCPKPAAVPMSALRGTGVADAFRITTDVPVVAYQINPFGGGTAAVTAASLLLPASVWDTNYVAVNVSSNTTAPPSLNIIAREDGTIATITPNAEIVGGGTIPRTPAGQPLQIALARGQHAQISQAAELTGSIITSNKPVGFMAGHVCMNVPSNVSFCDHGEQMIPPIRALGHRYAGVMYRPRVAEETKTFWRLIGTVDNTQLTWSTNVGGPATLARGQSVLFETGTPFVVSSQGKDHPFMLFTYMTSSQHVRNGYGDPDFVVSVPPEQYLKQYVFFTDPTYPETNLVLVRARGADQQFHEVTLDCTGPVQGWQPIDNDHEYTRVDLITGNFQPVGSCSTGRHEIQSTGPFGLWVWGWGTPATTPSTQNVSYGYPGGMNVAPINDVVIFNGARPAP